MSSFGKWIEITEKEFEILRKRAVQSHVIRFCEPFIRFYWDEEGAKNEDLSFGQHSFLKEQPEFTYPGFPTEPAKYWRINSSEEKV